MANTNSGDPAGSAQESLERIARSVTDDGDLIRKLEELRPPTVLRTDSTAFDRYRAMARRLAGPVGGYDRRPVDARWPYPDLVFTPVEAWPGDQVAVTMVRCAPADGGFSVTLVCDAPKSVVVRPTGELSFAFTVPALGDRDVTAVLSVEALVPRRGPDDALDEFAPSTVVSRAPLLVHPKLSGASGGGTQAARTARTSPAGR